MKKLFIILFGFAVVTLQAQSTRGLINDGVELYEEKKFADAEVNFKKGVENNFESFEGHFNLGDALYKQGRYDEAIKEFQNAAALTDSDYRKSKVWHNIGNSLLKSQKLKESIAAYKNALKLDPDDLETKYNLSWALKQQQQQQQNKDQQNQDKNKDQQNKDQDQNKDDQSQDKKDQQQDKQDQQQNQQDQKDKDQQNQNQQQPQPQEPKDEISKAEAERILQALKNNEQELQEKLRKRKAKVVPKAKDW